MMMSETEKESGVSDDFESWWRASKYCQVSHGDHRQVALDGWKAGTESLRQRVKELEARCIQHAGEKEKLKAELAALKGITAFNPNNAASNVQSGARHQTPLQDIYDTLYTSAPTIPEGWQLVPVIPTPEMLQAGRNTYSTSGSIYTAMLAAAPKPEE